MSMPFAGSPLPSERQEPICHSFSDIDIKENDILAVSPELLGILLTDHTNDMISIITAKH